MKVGVEIVKRYLVDFEPEEWEDVRDYWEQKRGLHIMEPRYCHLDTTTLRVRVEEILEVKENEPTNHLP